MWHLKWEKLITRIVTWMKKELPESLMTGGLEVESRRPPENLAFPQAFLGCEPHANPSVEFVFVQTLA